VKKEKKKLLRDEPPCKLQGPSVSETQYWINIFTEIEKNEQKD